MPGEVFGKIEKIKFKFINFLNFMNSVPIWTKLGGLIFFRVE